MVETLIVWLNQFTGEQQIAILMIASMFGCCGLYFVTLFVEWLME
jgi:hypothetical protein